MIPTGPAPHLGSVSKALLTDEQQLENVTGWFVGVSKLLGLLTFEAVTVNEVFIV